MTCGLEPIGDARTSRSACGVQITTNTNQATSGASSVTAMAHSKSWRKNDLWSSSFVFAIRSAPLVENGLTSTIAEEMATAVTTPTEEMAESCRMGAASGISDPRSAVVEAKAEMMPPPRRKRRARRPRGYRPRL